MIERGLITAAIVVVILGALGQIGNQADKMFAGINCAFEGQSECATITDSSEQGESDGDTRSTRDKPDQDR